MKSKHLFIVFIILFLVGCQKEFLRETETPIDFKVAFVGDTAFNNNSNNVYKLIKNEGAQTLFHLGDFFHVDNNATLWENQINSILGEDFPIFAVIGNHDYEFEGDWEEYQEVLYRKLQRTEGANCEGNIGVRSVCEYKGLSFILSGAGIKGPFYDPYYQNLYLLEYLPSHRGAYLKLMFISNYFHSRFIKNQFEGIDGWKICMWHEPQRLMQVGYHGDSSGWGVFEQCRKAGAFVVNGHIHRYSRSHLMSNYKKQKIVSQNSTLHLERGTSFVVNPSLGGMNWGNNEWIDTDLASNPWWAQTYAATDDSRYGALFCTFNVKGQKNRAECYFKTLAGEIIDQFTIINNKSN